MAPWLKRNARGLEGAQRWDPPRWKEEFGSKSKVRSLLARHWDHRSWGKKTKGTASKVLGDRERTQVREDSSK